jgi:hypothetical protein
MVPPHTQRLLADGAGRRRRRGVSRLAALGFCRWVISSSAAWAWRSSQASPGSWYIRATCAPAASRSRMTAITRRLAAAFCSNAQVGSRSSPARISARVITGYGPAPWPRVARQSAHISTVNSPPTLLNGPLVAPQNEQRSAISSSLELKRRWLVADDGRCSHPGPDRRHQDEAAAPAASDSRPWCRRPADRAPPGPPPQPRRQPQPPGARRTAPVGRNRPGEALVLGLPSLHTG